MGRGREGRMRRGREGRIRRGRKGRGWKQGLKRREEARDEKEGRRKGR